MMVTLGQNVDKFPYQQKLTSFFVDMENWLPFVFFLSLILFLSLFFSPTAEIFFHISQNKIKKNAKKRKIDQVQDKVRQLEHIKRLKRPI